MADAFRNSFQNAQKTKFGIYTVSKKNWDPYTHINNYVIFCFNGISFLLH